MKRTVKFESETVAPEIFLTWFKELAETIPAYKNETDKLQIAIGKVLSNIIIWFADHQEKIK